MPTLLVRYGEIGLKSASVRRRFEHALVEDIKRRHAMARTACVISSTRGRIYVDSDDWRRSCELLSKTFGIVSFSPVEKVGSNISDLTKGVLAYAEPLLARGTTFAIRSRRTGTHTYTSQTLAKELGSRILERYGNMGIRVALDEPELEISVEVRDREAFLFSSILPGPGGMPLGTQGKALCIVENEAGLASTWLMMKRGCTAMISARDESLVEPLRTWCPDPKLVAPESDMFSLANKHSCIGISLSWRLQEISEKGAPKGELPVFYPLVGMSDEEVSKLLERIRG
ncbi:MAG TPA: THUMP domain-containing protein [Thermoplasmata archaeon]